MTKSYQKKVKLGVHGKRTKWAPVWALVRKHSQSGAKFHHVSEMTKKKRSWKSTKLKIKPRRLRKNWVG